MSSGRFDAFRLFVFSLCLVAVSVDAFAQPRVSFQAFDTDANGLLSRGEFSRLPGYAGRPELFVDLDTNRDREVSSAEWIAGSPDEQGIPLGFEAAARKAAAAGAPKGTPAASTRHGPNVPRERAGGDPRGEPPPPLDPERLSRSAPTKRGMSPTAPRPSSNPIPPGARPPGG